MTETLRLCFDGDWSRIDAGREQLIASLRARIADGRLVDAIALAAHELIENGVKYSLDREVALEVELGPGGYVRVTAESRPDPLELAALEAELRRTCEAPDPLAYYRQRMQESSEGPQDRARLGLARIRCEAGMALVLELVEGRLRLTAHRSGEGGSP